MKRCRTCGITKPRTVEYFLRDPRKSDGLRGTCRKCTNEVRRRWVASNLGSVRAYARDYYAANKSWLAPAAAKYQRANRDKCRDNALRREYGITIE